MREILFKARITGTGEWVEGQYLDIMDCTEHHGMIINNRDDGSYGKFYCWKETVCQYTGLRDKNGQRIFEGDYISYFEDGDLSPDMRVAWDGTKCCFYKACVSKEGYPYRSPFDEIDIKHGLLLLTGRNIHDTMEATE